MKANLTTFGANQYKLPEQADQLKLYFSLQVMFIKSGNLLGQFSGPLLREKVECFNMKDCYPFAFGAPAVAMFATFFMFLCKKSFFVRTPPGGNMVVKVSCCVVVSFCH
jgi:solute carrier family 15 (oligopeptide transporter), member 1